MPVDTVIIMEESMADRVINKKATSFLNIIRMQILMFLLQIHLKVQRNRGISDFNRMKSVNIAFQIINSKLSTLKFFSMTFTSVKKGIYQM